MNTHAGDVFGKNRNWSMNTIYMHVHDAMQDEYVRNVLKDSGVKQEREVCRVSVVQGRYIRHRLI